VIALMQKTRSKACQAGVRAAALPLHLFVAMNAEESFQAGVASPAEATS